MCESSKCILNGRVDEIQFVIVFGLQCKKGGRERGEKTNKQKTTTTTTKTTTWLINIIFDIFFEHTLDTKKLSSHIWRIKW